MAGAADEAEADRPAAACIRAVRPLVVMVNSEGACVVAEFDAGFDEAFRRQLLPLVPKLRAFARTLARHDQDGDDLAQTAVMKAWRSRHNFELGTDLMRWLYRILRNEHISGVRSARRRGPHVSEGAERVIGPEDPHISLEYAELMRAVRNLPLAAREALILVGAGGMTYDEAAVVVGCPVGTVKTRVFRARLALAARFDADPPPRALAASPARA